MKWSSAARLVIGALAGLLTACNPVSPTPPDGGVLRPPPTIFTLHGVVTEPVGVPVRGAKVTIAAGTGQGRSAISQFDGAYALSDMKGTVTVEVTADGYTTVTRSVTVNQNPFDIEISPIALPADVAGLWQVTFDASSECGDFPVAARTRSYLAAVTQQGARIGIQVSGANLQRSAQFSGHVRGNGVAISVGDWDLEGIVERFGEDQFLTIWGDISATAAGPSITGILDGAFLIGDKPYRPYMVSGCTRPNHPVKLQRQ